MLWGNKYSNRLLTELDEQGKLEELGDSWKKNIELKELTFDMPSGDLRIIAKFLNEMAEKFENGTFKTDHIHIDQFSKEWRQKHPYIDIVVMDPNFDWDSVPHLNHSV